MISEDDLSLKLRVYITGGGCQGFQYGFAFEFNQEADDWCLQLPVFKASVFTVLSALSAAADPCASGADFVAPVVKILVDPISLQYLRDAEIDYVADGYGERFVVHNPSAKTTCGCARSFTPEAA